MAATSSNVHFHDIPDVILCNIFSLVSDTRSRNAMSLVCLKWHLLERSTRISLTLRGNIHVFAKLPLLEDLVLDICHNVRDAWPALELLNSRCPRLKSLKLGQFHGICNSKPDGIALCQGLESLSIKNSADLTDEALVSISLGCPRLSKFEILGCKRITGTGIWKLTNVLRKTLVDVKISYCKNLNAVSSLQALEPIRDRIERLHIDCVWQSVEQLTGMAGSSSKRDTKKKCKYNINIGNNENLLFSSRTWKKLQYLSLWIADIDVNQRSLLLPAAGLLAQCESLRKLFIHGTANEHFMMFLLRIPTLRDVQLREDYYPAPENDTSTEMRVVSCSRFEDALNSRQVPD
ncbi:Leucine-rich repeat, cysteine-containing subtype [Corchorus capsularis]|uniref:Leucine-rich repeat, cysteine-containing subtype n=1 Tax=Corchorus capsularis TaxID=210143 RepID=A0A1R3I0V5_COCAP|nr:Leucine-rich repeat, cysteine-containing subtype [Corchorus capsularis]